MEQEVGERMLKKLRSKVDRIDSSILRLLEKRWEATRDIGEVKRKLGLPYYDKKREGDIISKLTGKTKLKKDFVRRLFMKIVEYCRNGERR